MHFETLVEGSTEFIFYCLVAELRRKGFHRQHICVQRRNQFPFDPQLEAIISLFLVLRITVLINIMIHITLFILYFSF